jgi:hypothetical protein
MALICGWSLMVLTLRESGAVSGMRYGIAQVGDAAAGDDDRIVAPVRCTGQVGEVGHSFPNSTGTRPMITSSTKPRSKAWGGDTGAGDGDVLVPGDLPAAAIPLGAGSVPGS